MNCTEQALAFECGSDTLFGILTVPEAAGNTGIVIVVGGPQYRVGSHRQFVLIARRLAKAGYPVLRFDYRGMGDSTGAARDFEAVTEDIAAAITTLQRELPHVTRVVLWGLCDAASAALLYVGAAQDDRIAGLCLLNPWVRSEASLARAQVKHYYRDRLLQREFWLKLLRGGVRANALAGLWRNLRLMLRRSGSTGAANLENYQVRMALGWKQFSGDILLVLSGQDYTAKEFLEYCSTDSHWSGLLAQANVRRVDLQDADHTFSSQKMRTQVEDATLAWLGAPGRR